MHKNILIRTLGIFGILAVLAPNAWANLIWPALIIETNLLSVWAIAVGLVIEFIVLYFLFNMEVRKAIIVDTSMNAISTLFGIVLIPLAGIVWEIFPGLPVYYIFDVGTFNPFTWTATFIFAVMITAIIEILVIIKIFNISIDKKHKYYLCVANIGSVAVAFLLLWLKPRPY